MKVDVVTSRSEYRGWQDPVRTLFTRVFQRPFPAAIWRQYYEESPFGEPLVALATIDDEVVGHHALIPQVLEADDGPVRYLHSMSLMLDPEVRTTNIFFSLLAASHAAAEGSEAKFILGFPNANSVLPLRAFFNHRCIVETPLFDWAPQRPGHNRQALMEPFRSMPGLAHSHPFGEPYWSWRTALNQAKAVIVNGALALVYNNDGEGTITALDVECLTEATAYQDFLSFLHQTGAKTVRITGWHARRIGIPEKELQPHDGYTLRLCIRGLHGAQPPSVRLSLLLSDVF